MTATFDLLSSRHTRLLFFAVGFTVLRNTGALAQAQQSYQPRASDAMRASANSSMTLEFEAATLKAVDSKTGLTPGVKGGPGTSDPERIVYTNPLRRLLMTAYGVGSDFISGPAWLDTSEYTITATIRPGATKEEVNQMLRNLLAERLQITIHRETRDMPLYELTVVGKGPQLNEYVQGSFAPNGRGMPEGRDYPMQFGEKGVSHALANKVTISQLINFLSFQLKRPVVDKTGLTGLYNYKLDFAPSPGPDDEASMASAPDFITAVREQLGMKLTAKKGPLEIIVVDHAEKLPTNAE
jgi:uncharacterized protein (TIGR03435 family)